jgi:Tol biopolymer transport system component
LRRVTLAAVGLRAGTCCAAVVALLLGAGQASAASGAIVYGDAQSDGAGDIFSIEPARGQARRLTSHPAAEYDPAWSPDRRRIVFAKRVDPDPPYISDGLFVIRANGKRLERIPRTGRGHAPAWSPDGRRIAFLILRRDLKSAVFTIRVDGTRRRRVTSWSMSVDGVDWSPDGRWLVYDSRKAIKVTRADGRRKRVLVGDRDGRAFDWRSPSWAPDGSRIAFTGLSTKDGAFVYDIFTVRPDGSDRQNLTASRPAMNTCFPTCGRVDDDPSWSPDSAEVAFDENAPSEGGPNGIFAVTRDGSRIRRLTTSGAQPDW